VVVSRFWRLRVQDQGAASGNGLLAAAPSHRGRQKGNSRQDGEQETKFAASHPFIISTNPCRRVEPGDLNASHQAPFPSTVALDIKFSTPCLKKKKKKTTLVFNIKIDYEKIRISSIY
jgi:hypothetical protein